MDLNSSISEEVMQRLLDRAAQRGCSLDELLTSYLETSTPQMDLENFIDVAPGAVIIADESGKIIMVNRQMEPVFGYLPDELIGQPIEVLLPENLRSGHIDFRERYLQNPEARMMGMGRDLLGRRKDGTVFPVEVGLDYFKTGTQLLSIGFVTDITERKKTEKKLRASEDLLKRSQAIAHVGSWEINLATGENYWSDEFFRLCGLKPGSVEPTSELGLSFIHPEDRKVSLEAIKALQQTNVPYNIEKRIIRSDGEIREVISYGEIIKDAATGANKLLRTFTDITERKNMAEKLRTSEALLNQAQAISHVGSWEINLETGKTNWSHEFFRICGLRPGNVEPSSELGISIIHPDDRSKAAAAFEQTKKNKIPYLVEKRIVRPNGEVRDVISHGEVIRDRITGELKLVGTLTDVTERKKTEKQMFELALEKERAHLLFSFIRDAAHEFRTPLSVISVNAHLMAKLEDMDLRQEKVTRVDRMIQNISKLVDMLLLAATLEHGESLSFAEVDIAEVIEIASQNLRGQYQEKPALRFERPDEPLIAPCDEKYIRAAMTQVLDNAYRFTPEDGEIIVTVGREDGRIRIDVQDTGIGISERNLPRIFEMFWREDEAHTTPGFGLGLPIAKRIVERHNGEITVESEVGKGTKVRIVLP